MYITYNKRYTSKKNHNAVLERIGNTNTEEVLINITKLETNINISYQIQQNV